jgi:hypothetical protein
MNWINQWQLKSFRQSEWTEPQWMSPELNKNQSHKASKTPCHVFIDLNERNPQWTFAELNKNQPIPQASKTPMCRGWFEWCVTIDLNDTCVTSWSHMRHFMWSLVGASLPCGHNISHIRCSHNSVSASGAMHICIFMIHRLSLVVFPSLSNPVFVAQLKSMFFLNSSYITMVSADGISWD